MKRTYSLETVKFLIQSGGYPKIKSGQSSSSDILNRFNQALATDITNLAVRTSLVAENSSQTQAVTAVQAAAIAGLFASLNARTTTLQVSTMVWVDMHSSAYTETSNTAEVDYVFGQATLPILEDTNLLVQEDAYGDVFLPDDVKIYTAWTDDGSDPSILDYTESTDARTMLTEQTAWFQTWPGTDPNVTDFWLRIDFPFDFLGREPNVLEIWPLPAFGLTVKEVAYHQFGAVLASDWTALDLSYLPGYDETLYSNQYVNYAGPLRLHLPQTQISSIRIRVKATSQAAWGFWRIRLKHLEYEQTATLKVQNPYGLSVGSYYVKGKDPSDLAELSGSIASNVVSVSMSTDDPFLSPVITGVILQP